jgi:phage-related tail fiber protein
MSKNPVLIPRPFAVNGSKNSIHDTRQAGQDPEDATWSDGFPNVTMQPVESGGLPPKGMDFNGIFNALSDTAVHLQKGGLFYFDKVYSDSFGGYQTGAILISDDNTKLFISTSDNNTNNPNQNTKGWKILAGVGVNADTATKLQATCKINGVEFDGSTDINATPAGAVQFFAMSTAPVGWVKANGAAVSRALYANLFAAIGTTFGAGDGENTFNLPDLRGEFLRGWDDGRGVDSGRTLGMFQVDTVQRMTGEVGNITFNGDDYATGVFSRRLMSHIQIGTITPLTGNFKITFDSAAVARTSAETRPRNTALLACIKI